MTKENDGAKKRPREEEVELTQESNVKAGLFDEPNGFAKFGQQASIAETVGGNPERTLGQQQDAAWVGIATDSEILNEPVKFYENLVAAAVENNKNQRCGSTFNSALVRLDGEENFKIITANLGDSRSCVVIQGTNDKGAKVATSLSLTEDHEHDLRRVQDYAMANKASNVRYFYNQSGTKYLGVAAANKLDNCSLALGAAVGDCLLTQDGKDPLLRKPDVWSVSLAELKEFAKEEGIDMVNNIELITSCDGLFEGSVEVSAMRRQDKDGALNFVPMDVPEGTTLLHSLCAEDSDKNNLAQHLARRAVELRSTDNVSVIAVDLMKDGKVVAPDGLMTNVADGHGLVVYDKDKNCFVVNKKDRPDLVYDANKTADGSDISSNVAARLFCAAQAQEIAGLEIGHERPKLSKEIENLRNMSEGLTRQDTTQSLASTVIEEMVRSSSDLFDEQTDVTAEEVAVSSVSLSVSPSASLSPQKEDFWKLSTTRESTLTPQ